MITSELTNELDAALSLFQGEMPVIKKDVNVNMKGVSKSGKEFNVNYDYAPLESIQQIANPLLCKHGLNVSQDIAFIFTPTNTLLHIIETRVAHKSGQWKMSSWPLDMSGVSKEQDRGSKITFNKRYAFVAALNIALSDEDNDAVDVKANIKNPKLTETDNQNLKATKQSENDTILFGWAQIKGKKFTEVDAESLSKAIFGTENYYKEKNIKMSGSLAANISHAKSYLNSLDPSKQ